MASSPISPDLQRRSTTELPTDAGAFPASTFLIVLVNNVSSWPSYEIQSSNGVSDLLLYIHSNLSTSLSLLISFFHLLSGFYFSFNIEHHLLPVSRSRHTCSFIASPEVLARVYACIL